MPGFFHAADLAMVRAPLPTLPQCGRCGLWKSCHSPKMPLYGEGSKGVLVVGEAPGCITGDSLVDTAFRDKTKFPDGIPIKDLVGQSGFYVYSFDVGEQRLVLGRVRRVWKTGRKKVWRVTYQWKYPEGTEVVWLSNSLCVTANHPFLLKRRIAHDPFLGLPADTDYLSLEQGLGVGHSLQPFHRHSYKYARVGASHKDLVREARFLLAFKLGRGLPPAVRGRDREECRHINGCKLDDSWDNLQLLSTADHAFLHATELNPMDRPGVREKHLEAMQDDEYRERQSKHMKGVLANPENYRRRVEQIRSRRKQTSESVRRLYNDPGYYLRYLYGRQRILSLSDEWVETTFRKKFPDEEFPVDNHKIIAVEEVGIRDVYDMEIDTYHNFAVNGIFVHNSTEDKEGIPFCGKTGQYLRGKLARLGIDLKADCWVTNAARCRPENNDLPGRAVEYCRPLLVQAVQELQPRAILLLGGYAVQGLLGWLWKEDVGSMGRWAGWKIPVRRLNAWVIPTWHPSYLCRSEGERYYPVLEREYERHLARAVKVRRRPYPDGPPDVDGKLRLVYDDREVARFLDCFRAARRPITFDFETTHLKPDAADAAVVCCAVSNGEVSVAYPWTGAAVAATRRLLEDPAVPKRGHHVKFEQRWCLKMGWRVRGWEYCGMVGAHVLDNRPGGICGLKFQAFVRLGIESYDDTIRPYLASNKPNTPNRVREVPLPKLLKYCALDALYEYQVDALQMAEMEVER